jgi:hypothetical protein
VTNTLAYYVRTLIMRVKIFIATSTGNSLGVDGSDEDKLENIFNQILNSFYCLFRKF